MCACLVVRGGIYVSKQYFETNTLVGTSVGDNLSILPFFIADSLLAIECPTEFY